MFWNVNVDQFKDLLQSGDSFVAIIVENSLFCFYFWVGLYILDNVLVWFMVQKSLLWESPPFTQLLE